MLKGLIFAMLTILSAQALAVQLKAPAYPWSPGVSHSNVTHAFVTGFDSAGNPEGLCTYYEGNGFPLYAYCGWDLSGAPLYATPAPLSPYQASKLFVYGEPMPGGWLQAQENGYRLMLSDAGRPPISELITP
jgi:hypothetical protein